MAILSDTNWNISYKGVIFSPFRYHISCEVLTCIIACFSCVVKLNCWLHDAWREWVVVIVVSVWSTTEASIERRWAGNNSLPVSLRVESVVKKLWDTWVNGNTVQSDTNNFVSVSRVRLEVNFLEITICSPSVVAIYVQGLCSCADIECSYFWGWSVESHFKVN